MTETTLPYWTIGAALALVATAVAAEPMGEATRYVSTVGGRERTFIEYVPTTLKPGAPLLFVLHPSGGDAAVGKHKSYAYRFEATDRTVVFTGDTGPNDALTNLSRGADLLVSESNSVGERMQLLIKSGQWQVMTPAEQAGIKRQMAQGHLSTEDVGKLAAQAGVKTVVLTHVTSKPDDDYTSWVNDVKKYFSGQVLVAKDLMEF